MTSAYDDALGALHRVPFEAFVAERKRLAAELASAGDRTGAARLAKLPRPAIAAWVVNQLFWRERGAFDRLFATAERLRQGEVDAAATSAYRAAIADLRARAAKLLADAGKSPSEATLHRVSGTLSVLAAAGGFQPDPPGALQRDRDPVGFDVPGLRPPAPAERTPAAAAAAAAAAAPRDSATQERAPEAGAAEERRRVERERARRTAERQRLARELRAARSELETGSAAVARLEQALAQAMDPVERSRATVRDLEAQLAELTADDDSS